MKSVILILLICSLSRATLAQGTSCSDAIPITMNGVINDFPTGSATGSPVVCTNYSTSSPVTWFSFTANASGECPLLNISVSDNNPFEVAFYTYCTTNMAPYIVNSSSMCFDDGEGIWAPSQTFVLTPNQIYYLRIKTASACNISIAGQHTTPDNLECNGALALGSTSITDNNACHKPPTEVTAGQLCALSLENTAFYRFYIATQGSAIINISNITCDNGSTNNNGGFQIGFFQGSCGSLTPINCESGTGTFIQATTAQLPAGTPVIVAIDGMNGSNCQYTITAINALQVLSGNSFKKFSGWKTQHANILKWITMNDSALYYEIERSENGNSFEVIGKVYKTQSNQQEQIYNFEDIEPKQRAFYRLKVLDSKGKTSLSTIIFIERKDIPLVEIKLNNPARNLDLQVRTNFAGMIEYKVISSAGQLVSVGKLNCLEGTNHFIRSTGTIPNGRYALILNHKEVKIVKNFILLK